MKINKLICFLIHHKYEKHQPLSRDSDMIICNRCQSKWAMNHSLKIILPWDSDLEDMYKNMFKTHILKTEWEN